MKTCCSVCDKYRKFKNPKISYIFKTNEVLILSLYSKSDHKYKKILKKEKSIEILKIFDLKSNSNLPKKFSFICFNESPLKMMKNTFYFNLKALFVLKILKFLSWHFGHVEETA